jgi:hypothetical protein
MEVVGPARWRCGGGHGGSGEIRRCVSGGGRRVVASFCGPTGGRQWLWCSEGEGSGLVRLGVEETEKMDGWGGDGENYSGWFR